VCEYILHFCKIVLKLKLCLVVNYLQVKLLSAQLASPVLSTMLISYSTPARSGELRPSALDLVALGQTKCLYRAY